MLGRWSLMMMTMMMMMAMTMHRTTCRLAFFLSRGFNELLVGLGRKPLFYYLVSGSLSP
jgi:hypothetical protein